MYERMGNQNSHLTTINNKHILLKVLVSDYIAVLSFLSW